MLNLALAALLSSVLHAPGVIERLPRPLAAPVPASRDVSAAPAEFFFPDPGLGLSDAGWFGSWAPEPVRSEFDDPTVTVLGADLSWIDGHLPVAASPVHQSFLPHDYSLWIEHVVLGCGEDTPTTQTLLAAFEQDSAIEWLDAYVAVQFDPVP